MFELYLREIYFDFRLWAQHDICGAVECVSDVLEQHLRVDAQVCQLEMRMVPNDGFATGKFQHFGSDLLN